jgi:hypothetical protein
MRGDGLDRAFFLSRTRPRAVDDVPFMTFGSKSLCFRQLAGAAPVLLCLGAMSFMHSQAFADSQSVYLQCLTNFETYAETIWSNVPTGSTYPTNAGFWGDGGNSGNGAIRGNCGIAVAYAALVLAQPDSPRNSTRISRIAKALNYAAQSHVSGSRKTVNSGKWGWSSGTLATCTSQSGSDWQSAEWAGSMGLACVLMRSNLPAQTIADCQAVVASEATHRAGIVPCSGYVSDTKSEENGWDSNILALGAAWMNTNASAATWLAMAKSYLVNTFTVADTNGDPLAAWVSTVTLYPSFSLQNHGFYHPTYEMVGGMSLGDSWLMAKAANPAVAAELLPYAEHNVMAVWTNNLQLMVMDSGDFAYPAGVDWELHDYEQNSYITWLATHFNDPVARWTDAKLASLVRARQVVNGDGRFIGPSGGGFYREAVEARRTAIAWLLWANADYPTGPATAPAPVVASYPDVSIAVHRTTNGYVSLSYGSRVMVMIEAPAPAGSTNVFVATPLLPGVIGLGALGDPSSASLVSFTTNANGFEAELSVVNSSNGRTEVYLKSTGETVAVVEVPWPVSGFVASAASSFDTGIENDPLCGGSRLLEWAGRSATVTNLSGTSVNLTNDWVCVSGRYGMAAGPAGYFNYQASSSYNRLGAAQDVLQYMPASLLSPRYAVYFPGKTAAQTAAGAAAISWTVSGTNVFLSFPGAGGVLQTLSAVAPLDVPYDPYQVPVSSIAASSYQSGYPAANVVDTNYSTFWVSAGTTAGAGPTTNSPAWLSFNFARSMAVSEFMIYPRTYNGGYGPKTIQMFFNSNSVYQGTMSATTTLDVLLSPPVAVTNALLLITSSYDPTYPTSPRNVQVIETVFYERAMPGTYADWQLNHFTDTQLADASVSGLGADPDGDGVPNLLEFAAAADPWAADAALAKVEAAQTVTNTLRLRYRERASLSDVSRGFQLSTNLALWSEVTPVSLTTISNLGSVLVRDAVFPSRDAAGFYRVRFSRTN